MRIYIVEYIVRIREHGCCHKASSPSNDKKKDIPKIVEEDSDDLDDLVASFKEKKECNEDGKITNDIKSENKQ